MATNLLHRYRFSILCIAGLLISLFILGCAAKTRVAKLSNTFLSEVKIEEHLKTLPYQHSWVRPAFDASNFKTLHIKPIRLDQLPIDSWKAASTAFITSKQDFDLEAAKLAEYFRSELVSRIRSEPEHRFKLVDTPGPATLTLEIALTELEFSRPVARAASLALPVPGVGIALSAVSDPHVAFAARLSDPSGRLVATAADRKFPPTRLIDLNKLTFASSTREVCAIWAETLAATLNSGALVPVKDRSSFSLLPW